MSDSKKIELTESRLKEIKETSEMTEQELQQILTSQKTIEKIQEYFQENKWKIGKWYLNDDGREEVYDTEDLEEIGKILGQHS